MSSAPETIVSLVAHGGSDRAALIYRDQVMSFSELMDVSARVATGLKALGVGFGDRIGFWLPNVPAYMVLFLACARLGAIAVAVNTRFRSAEVDDIVGRSGCKLLILWPSFEGIDYERILGDLSPQVISALDALIVYDEVSPIRIGLAGLPEIVYQELLDNPPHNEAVSDPATPSNIFTTSGTTKAPKFVLHTQASLTVHARDVACAFGYDAPDTVLLQALPFGGVFGFCQATAAFAAGRPSVLQASFDADEALKQIARHRVTHLNGSDEMFVRLLAADAEGVALTHLEWCGFAQFNPAYAAIADNAETHGLTLCGLYGMSEVQALFAAQPKQAQLGTRKRAGGLMVSTDAKVRARDPKSGQILPPGEPGELEFSAPSLMAGYFGDAEATAKAYTDDGYFKSGDLGYTEADGGFVFLNRLGDALRLGGYLVNPAEIEFHLLAPPSVDECHVVDANFAGRPAAVAFVIPNSEAAFDETALVAHCKQGLARFKVPVRILAVDGFPTTPSPNGVKVQRAKLRQMAQSHIDLAENGQPD